MEHLKVIHGAHHEDQDGHNSKLITTRAFSSGQVVADFSQIAKKTTVKAYTTLQVSRTEHVDLNCDLTYMNHSCRPSCRIDCERMQVVAIQDLPENAEITFFYPSTEWEMANPFECWCGSPLCLRRIQGAKFVSTEDLAKFPFINRHIHELKAKQQQQSN